MRYLLKNLVARKAFQSYLQRLNNKGEEYLQCYIDLEELKIEHDMDKILIANTFIISKYTYDPTVTSDGTITPDDAAAMLVNKSIWDKLQKLRDTNVRNTNRDDLIRLVLGIQHQMLNELIDVFDVYLASKDYKEWKNREIKIEKQQTKPQTQTPNPSAITTIADTPSKKGITVPVVVNGYTSIVT